MVHMQLRGAGDREKTHNPTRGDFSLQLGIKD